MKVVFAGFRYDYGEKNRGESLEKNAFFPAMSKCAEVIPFWLEENGYPENVCMLQDKLIRFVHEHDPKVVFFVLMKDEILPKTLQYLKKGYCVVNWFCDDAWRFDDYTVHMIPYFSHCITVDKYSIHKYERVGFYNPILSQWGISDFDPDIDFSKVEYRYDVSFVGGINVTREWVVYELSKRGIKVDCFGHGWRNGRITYLEMSNLFKSSKINLNLSNSIPTDINFIKFLFKKLFVVGVKVLVKPTSINISAMKLLLCNVKSFLFSTKRVETVKARNFEILGCGGFQISKFALEIEDYYDIGKEIVLFSTIDELEKQIKYYLYHNQEREEIRSRGYKRTVNYTYENRFKDVFDALRKSM